MQDTMKSPEDVFIPLYKVRVGCFFIPKYIEAKPSEKTKRIRKDYRITQMTFIVVSVPCLRNMKKCLIESDN